jgi:hypothetical protein
MLNFFLSRGLKEYVLANASSAHWQAPTGVQLIEIE